LTFAKTIDYYSVVLCS